MKIIMGNDLQYYCNSLGELHEHGERMLDSVLELPAQLQAPYEDLWTDNLSVCCYVAFLAEQPGIVLVSEYDEDYCQTQGLPNDADAQYVEIFGYASRLERLAQEINKDTIVGICNDDTCCGIEIMLFIPTERIPIKDIPKLYYLMDQFGYNKPPDSVRWSKYELSKFIHTLNLHKSIEQEMIDSQEPYMEFGSKSGHTLPPLEYMGLKIKNDDLYTRKQLIAVLRAGAGTDNGLKEICSQYTQKFGNQLVWKYSFFDDAHDSGAIIPVQEGFLFLPYSPQCLSYDVNGIERLDAGAVETLKAECKAYFDGLMAALSDIETELRACPVRYYSDKEGRIYLVRSGADGMYKGFRRCTDPKNGQHRETELRTLVYTHDFRKAQLDLDMYAQEHKLRQLDITELQKAGIVLD